MNKSKSLNCKIIFNLIFHLDMMMYDIVEHVEDVSEYNSSESDEYQEYENTYSDFEEEKVVP